MNGNLELEERVLAEDKAQLENHLAAKRKAIAVCNQGVVQKLYDVILELGWDCYDNVTVEIGGTSSPQVLMWGKNTIKSGSHQLVLVSIIKMLLSSSKIKIVGT